MTGLRRFLGLFVSVVACSSPSWAYAPDELSDTFKTAIDLLHRGKKSEALVQLKKVAAMSPDQKAAYELWKSTDYADWRDLLVQGGDFELIAKRLIELARVERKAAKNDKDVILGLVRTATTSEDATERRKAAQTLVADHGEYAVPYLLALLSDSGDEDRRVLAMHALSQMGNDAAVPVAEALEADNPVLRRNAAFVLGNLGSPLGIAALQHAAASDTDEVVRTAAADALRRLNAQGNALSNYLAAGDAYWRRSDVALSRGEAGEVVWDWKGRPGRRHADPARAVRARDEQARVLRRAARRSELGAGAGRAGPRLRRRPDAARLPPGRGPGRRRVEGYRRRDADRGQRRRRRRARHGAAELGASR